MKDLTPTELLLDVQLQGATILQAQPDAACDSCGDIAELRPYGPGGSNICLPCAMKDEEATKRRFLGDQL